MRTFLPVHLLLALPLSAQTTFAPTGAKWTYTQHHAFSPDSGLFVIQSVGDTVIQGVNCSILEHTEGVSGCMPFHRYMAALGDSVLFWNPGANAFRVLLAFGTPIGSSWSCQADHGDGSINPDILSFTVTDTGSVIVNGHSLRNMNVEIDVIGINPSTDTWPASGIIRERMGDLNYLFPWIFFACDGEYNLPLRCYEDPELGQWLNPQFEQCDLSTGLTDPFVSSELMVSPTVIERGGTISITSAGSPAIELLDATGRIAQRARTPAMITIDRPGIYFIRNGIGSQAIRTRRVLVR